MEKHLLEQDYLLIIEVGPGNVKKNQLTLITKDSRKQIMMDDINHEINLIKELSDKIYYQLSLKKVLEFNKKQTDFEKIELGNRFCCCLDKKCIEKIQEKINFRKLYFPFTNVRFSKKCIVCQKEGNNIVFGGE